MKANLRVIGLSLALTAGLLLVSGAAWAQAVETPITVRMYAGEIEEPERAWVDEDGIEHGRDALFWHYLRRDMVGTCTGWVNWDIDWAGDHRFGRAYYSFTGWVLGEPATGVGRYKEECDRIEGVWNCTSDDLMHLDGGGLVKLSGTFEWDERVILSGTLLDPPGGESRQGPRPRRRR